jgi:hypothetical protein
MARPLSPRRRAAAHGSHDRPLHRCRNRPTFTDLRSRAPSNGSWRSAPRLSGRVRTAFRPPRAPARTRSVAEASTGGGAPCGRNGLRRVAAGGTSYRREDNRGGETHVGMTIYGRCSPTFEAGTVSLREVRRGPYVVHHRHVSAEVARVGHEGDGNGSCRPCLARPLVRPPFVKGRVRSLAPSPRGSRGTTAPVRTGRQDSWLLASSPRRSCSRDLNGLARRT